jgi:Ca2+:H+ antiporter
LKRDKRTFIALEQFRVIILNSWINVFLVFIPIGITANFVNAPKALVFGCNFTAIIPLAAVLSFATEEIALRTGETVGGFLNATFG